MDFQRLIPIVLGFLILAAPFSAGSAEELVVFYPATIRSNALQKKIAAACPIVEVTVYGKYNDFRERLSTNPPDAILTSPLLAEQLDDYSIELHGERTNSREETFLVLSLQDAPAEQSAAVGAVDFLGKNGMNRFVGRYFPEPAILRRTTKVEDLLSLLTFGMVRSVVVTQGHAIYLAERSTLKFKTVAQFTIENGLVSLSVRKGEDVGQIKKCIMTLDTETLDVLGVELWKK